MLRIATDALTFDDVFDHRIHRPVLSTRRLLRLGLTCEFFGMRHRRDTSMQDYASGEGASNALYGAGHTDFE